MSHRLITPPRLVATALCCAMSVSAVEGAAAVEQKRSYNLPSGDAATTLNQFAGASGQQIVFMMEKVKGERTNVVTGEHAAHAALDLMLAGTGLSATRDPATGAFVVSRKRSDNSGKATPRSESTRAPPSGTADSPDQPTPSQSSPNSPSVKNRNLLTLLATWISATAAFSAQNPAAAPKEEPVVLSAFSVSATATGRYQATEATSGGRVRVSLMDSTQSVSVVTRDLIEDIGAGRIMDAAKYVAGINESTLPNALDRATLRGFQADGATVDGFNYISFANVDPVIIERIEVVKGPNAILSPQGVPGGTINLVSRKPFFSNRGSISAQVGRYDANRIELDVNRVLLGGKAAIRVVGSEERSEHIADGNFKSSTVVMPMFTYRLKPGTELTVQAQLYNTWGGAYGGLPVDLYVGTNDEARLIPTISPELDLYGKAFARHSSAQIFRLLFTSAITPQLSVRLAANVAYTKLSSVGIGNGNPVGTGLLVTRNEQTGAFAWNGTIRNDDPEFPRSGNVGFQTRDSYNVQNDYVYDVKLDGIKATTVAGFSMDFLKNPNYNVGLTIPNFKIRSFTFQPYTLTTRTSNQINYAKTRQFYLSQTLSLVEDRLKLNAGVARSRYVNYVSDLFPGRTRTASLTPQATLPSFGALFKPMPGFAVFAGFSKQATAQFISSTFTPVTPTQDSKQWEVGVRAQLLDQRLFSTVTYFDIKQNNFGVPNPANAFVPTPVPALPPLLTNRLAHGVEFELTFVVSKNLSLVGNATVMKNRDVDDVPFRGTSEKSWATWINYNASKGDALQGWSFGVGIDYLAKRPGDLAQAFTSLSTPTRIIRQQPSFYLPERTLVNAKIGYRIDAQWRAQLNIDNVFDQEYLAASTARNTVFPGTPLNPKLSVTYGF